MESNNNTMQIQNREHPAAKGMQSHESMGGENRHMGMGGGSLHEKSMGGMSGGGLMGRNGGEMGHKAKKMKTYKKMCEKAIDRMSALFGQSVEPHEMTKALMLAVKKGSPEEIVSAIEIFSDYRWAVNEKKELAEEFDSSEEED